MTHEQDRPRYWRLNTGQLAGMLGLTFSLGACLGLAIFLFLIRTPSADMHSFGGGASYITLREASVREDPSLPDPLWACQRYVDAGMYTLDGYDSAKDFLSGCQDASQGKR